MLKIGFVGDINPGEYYTSLGHGPRDRFDNKEPLADLKNLLQEYDYAVGNLEAPVTEKKITSRNFFDWGLIGNSNSIRKLKEANFGYLTVSNNHSIQHGAAVFTETLSILEKYKIKALGLNKQELTVIKKDDVTVGILAASDVPDNTDKNQKLYQVFNQDFLTNIKECVNKVDHLVVLLHWGDESSTTPNPHQREISAALKNIGVRAVIGSHSHLFYEIERDSNFICAYSLGNFIFDLTWEKRLTYSGLLTINFSKSEFFADVTPLRLTDHGCTPKVSGGTKAIRETTTLYDNGSHMKYQQIKKILYLLRYIYKGKTFLKIKFLKSKIIK